MSSRFEIVEPDADPKHDKFQDYGLSNILGRVHPIVGFPFETMTFKDMDEVLGWTKGFFSPALDEINHSDYEIAVINGKLMVVASFVVKLYYFEDFKKACYKHGGVFLVNHDNNPKPEWMERAGL